MPLIQFPNVPLTIGVPDVNRLAGQALNSALAASGLLDVLGVSDAFGLEEDQPALWQILDRGGNQVVAPDSVLIFEHRAEQKLATHPVEEGAFATYNKTASPYDIRLRMTCGGQGVMSRDQFLETLSSMLDSIELFVVVTPDQAYENCNLDHLDYKREAKNGVTLLTVDAWFTEVRVTAVKAYTNTAAPSGAATVSNGTVQPGALSPEVSAAVAQAGVM